MRDIDDPLDARLRSADPARRLTVDDTGFDDLLRQTTARRRPRRRSVVIGAAVIAVVAMGAGATPAAADVVKTFLAQTGWFGDSPNPGGQATGAWGEEYIDLLAPDTRDYIVSRSPAYIPLPTGTSRAKFDQDVADQIIAAARRTSKQNDGVGVTEHAILVQRSFEQYAYNQWIRLWLEADDRGDEAARTRAAHALRAACTWPAFAKTDGGGGGALMKDFAHAAETDDVEGVQAAAQFNAAGHPGSTGWDGVARDWWIKKHLS